METSDFHLRWKRYATAPALLAIMACSSAVTRVRTSLVPVSHSISKTEICVGEPVVAKMSSLSSDRTDNRINYVIGGVPGNVTALTYDQPGDYQVLFAASDGKAMDQQSITVHVRDCGKSFEYVTVQGVPLAFHNDTFHVTAVVRSLGLVGDDNRSEGFLEAKEVAYEWEFGDGTVETTTVPYVKHSYAERDERSTLNSTFTVTVKAHANGLAKPIGKTTVTLPNLYKANLNNGKIVPKVAPARAAAQAGGGYTAKLEVNNLEAETLDLSSAIVMPIACDGTDSGEKTVDAASIFSKRRLPPGHSSLDITIPAGAITADTCRMRYEVTGKSAYGRPVVLVAVVFVRDPPVESVDTTTPEHLAKVQVVEAAMRALGRVDPQGNLSGTVSEAEIYELQLKGMLESPPTALRPNGCGSCTTCQVCKVVSTIPYIAAPGHGTYAVKGDIAFLHNPKSEIGALIAALGETWTHTGIMVDGNNCRSDLMGGQAGTPLKNLVEYATVDAVSQWIGQSTCKVGSPYVGQLKISPANLYQGTPGVITQAMYSSSYFYPYSIYLAQPAGLASTTYSPRWTLQAAANTANGIKQRYGIYSYSDWTYAANQPGTYELTPKGIPSGHEGCSGFVRKALYNTAKTLPNFALNSYTATTRQNAANGMYNALKGDCTSSGISGLIYQTLMTGFVKGSLTTKIRCTAAHPWQCPTNTLTDCQINKLQNSCNGVGTGISQWTQGLLNQVLNCFAFGDVGNGGTQVCTGTNSTAWQNPGTGSGTISPQSVYDQMGTKYSATYRQEILYPTIWGTQSVSGCVAACPNPTGCSNDCSFIP